MLTLPEKIFEKEADESPLNKQTKKNYYCSSMLKVYPTCLP